MHSNCALIFINMGTTYSLWWTVLRDSCRAILRYNKGERSPFSSSLLLFPSMWASVHTQWYCTLTAAKHAWGWRPHHKRWLHPLTAVKWPQTTQGQSTWSLLSVQGIVSIDVCQLFKPFREKVLYKSKCSFTPLSSANGTSIPWRLFHC